MNSENHTFPDLPETAEPSQETPAVGKKRTWSFIFRIAKILGYVLGGFLALSVFLVLCLRWIPPFTSSFMMQDRLSHIFHAEKNRIAYHWIPWKSIPLHIPLAIIAAEDQKFPSHHGFDFHSISQAMEENKYRKRPRGASTITQQVAKNLFLWSGQSYFRKGLEAYFTVLLELLWSKKRILEVYLNIAEFGDNTYGVAAAAKRFWAIEPSRLSSRQAAILAAVLPSPKRLHAANPSPYVEKRAEWIVQQMQQLGILYLKEL